MPFACERLQLATLLHGHRFHFRCEGAEIDQILALIMKILLDSVTAGLH
jgi:hypothetical protein